MSAIEREILTQPADWRRAAALAPGHAALLPQPGERVVAVGCGTSLHMAQSYAAAREAAGAGETDHFPASEMPAGRRYDRLVAISRSGTTSEVVRLLEAVAPSLPTLVITAVAGSPCAERATAAIVLDYADEESVVQTRFATTALALLLAGIGFDIDAEAAAAALALLTPVPDLTRARALRVPRLGLDGRPGQRGRAQAAGGGRGVGRRLPRDGVPPWPDQRQRRRDARLADRRGRSRRARRRRPRGLGDRRERHAARSPRSCSPSASPSLSRAPATSTLTTPIA